MTPVELEANPQMIELAFTPPWVGVATLSTQDQAAETVSPRRGNQQHQRSERKNANTTTCTVLCCVNIDAHLRTTRALLHPPLHRAMTRMNARQNRIPRFGHAIHPIQATHGAKNWLTHFDPSEKKNLLYTHTYTHTHTQPGLSAQHALERKEPTKRQEKTQHIFPQHDRKIWDSTCWFKNPNNSQH